jgi:hypothetical protein
MGVRRAGRRPQERVFMAAYYIGSKSYLLDSSHARVLKQLVAQVSNKLNLSPYADRVRCGQTIAAEWLGPILEELDRWYLDDYDPETSQMVIPKEDIDTFKKLNGVIAEIVGQNTRKSEKFVTTAQAQTLSKEFSEFLREFTPEEQVINDFHRNGYQLPKKVLSELITRAQEGIEKGKKISYRD